MATEGLRQRKNSSKKTQKQLERANTPVRSNVSSKKKKDSTTLYLIILIIYFPFLAIFNPSTFSKWLSLAFPPTCEGTCAIAPSLEGSVCPPVETDRLVFVRITKTASTSLIKLIANQHKATTWVDLGELEDVVSSIPTPGLSKERLGYHDPDTRLERFRKYFKAAARTIIYPPFENQQRTFFQGHSHYFDFPRLAPIFYPNSTSLIPDFLLNLYNQRYPPAPLQIRQFTVLRHPHARLASMYHYDRHDARTQDWRKDFVQKYGNSSLNACLVDSKCLEENDISRWCNLQTELLCGATDCQRGDNEEALVKAKATIKDKLFFVGTVERFPESVQLLKKLVPQFLEDLSEELPRERVSVNRPKQLSEASQAKLNELCRFDEALYEYANELLTQRLQECSVGA